MVTIDVIEYLKEIVAANPKGTRVRYWKRAIESVLHGSVWNDSFIKVINDELEIDNEHFRIRNLDFTCISINILK